MTSHPWHRRDFLKTSTSAAAVITLRGSHTWRQLPTWFRRQVTAGETSLRDPRVKAIVLRALDAARSAGAQYAEVHVTYTKERVIAGNVAEQETLALSVRALVNGHWGFAASPLLTETEAPRLGHQAVALAQSLASHGAPHTVEWAPTPVVPSGDWTTPIQIDPFTLSLAEVLDHNIGIVSYATSFRPGIQIGLARYQDFWIEAQKQERVFASTEGTYLTQTLYRTGGRFGCAFPFPNNVMVGAALPSFNMAAAGWEYVQEAQFIASLPRLFAEAEAEAALPLKDVDVGRYDVVCDASAMAAFVANTLGTATELDRALGYEANAGGTSYLGPDPTKFLGTAVASPLINITANRTMARGLATTGSDAEGVAPQDFPLVHEGMLVDYQTTREQAAWLAPWYQRHGLTPKSHGCAWSPTASEVPMQHTPNLVLQPGTKLQGLDELVAGVETGLLVRGMSVQMDQQRLNGDGAPGSVFHVKHGKRIARSVKSISVIFRTPELWKNVLALGGSQSQGIDVGSSEKGDPSRRVPYTVSAVPAVIKQLAIIDPMRKA